MNVFNLTGKKAIVDYLATLDWRASLLDSKGNELESGEGYATGGAQLTNPRSGSESDAAFLTFDDAMWSNASFSGARYMKLSAAGTDYATIDFGADKAGQGADFTYKFPRTGGVIRI